MFRSISSRIPRRFASPSGQCLVGLVLVLALTHSIPATAQVMELIADVKDLMHPPVEVPIEHPPKHWLHVEQVAFAEATGKCADELVSILREEFVRRGIRVVDRAHLETVLQEHGLIHARLVEEKTAIQLGKILGATTLMTLEVQRCEDESKTWSEARRSDRGTTYAYFSSSWTYVKGLVQVIDLETTQIFSAEVFNSNAGQEVGPSYGRVDPPPIFPIHDRVVQLAAMEVVKLLFPWDERVEMPFYNGKKCGMKEVYRRVRVSDFEGAESLAEMGIAQCSGRKDSVRSKAHYDLGVTRFLLGKYDEALESFETAYRLDVSDDTLAGVRLAQRAIESSGRLAGYERFVASKNPQSALTERYIEDRLETADKERGTESVRDRLEKLKQFFDAGLITEKDYEAKKAEILAEF